MNMFMNYCVFCDIVKCNSENNSKISVGVMNNRSNLIYQNDPKFKEKVIENDIKKYSIARRKATPRNVKTSNGTTTVLYIINQVFACNNLLFE